MNETSSGTGSLSSMQAVAPKRGYDSLRDNFLNEGVTGEINTGTATGQTVAYEVLIIEDENTLHTKLGISYMASIQTLHAGLSARYEFMQDSNFNSYSIFLMLRMYVINAPQGLPKATLSDEAKQLLSTSTLEDFYHKYGDSFISDVVTGGDLYALLQYTAETYETLQAIKWNLNGHIGPVSSASEFLQKHEELSKRSVYHSLYYRYGGSGPTKIDKTTFERIVDEFATSVNSKTGQPSLISFTRRNYNSALGWPADKKLSFEAQENLLGELGFHNTSALRLKKDVDFILAHPSQFENPDIDKLKKDRDILNSILKQITDAAAVLYADPFTFTRNKMPNIDFTQFALPKQKIGPVHLSVSVLLDGDSTSLGRDRDLVGTSDRHPIKMFSIKINKGDEDPRDLSIHYRATFSYYKAQGGFHFVWVHQTDTGHDGKSLPTSQPPNGTAYMELRSLGVWLEGREAGYYDVWCTGNVIPFGYVPNATKNGDAFGNPEHGHPITALKVWIVPKGQNRDLT